MKPNSQNPPIPAKQIPSERVSDLLDAIKAVIQFWNFHAPEGLTVEELKFRRRLIEKADKIEGEFEI